MMRPKRLLLTLFVVLLGTTICQAKSFKYQYKNITFKCKIVEGGVDIIEFDMKAEEVVIPANAIDHGTTYQVKAIDTFLNGVNYLASKIEIEEGVESIESRAFMEFRKLKEVNLPSSLQRIGKNIIRPNQDVTFYIPNNVDVSSIKNDTELTLTPSSVSRPLGSSVSAGKDLAQNTKPTVKEEPKQEPAKAESKTKTAKTSSKSEPTKKAPPVEMAAADELDTNIPLRKVPNQDNVYCVIIANENYRDVSEVEYANNDGHIFMEYCKKTLGIPENHIRSFFDATYTDMKRALSWMENIASVTDGKAKMIFYYAGHGLPNDKDQSAYLIPADGFPNDITTCFKLSDIYDRLAKLNVQNVTVLLDACFSGVNRGEGKALVASRGVAIKTKKESLSGNLVIMSAASDDETAFSYKSKKHGMFTYYLLKKLRESKGDLSLGEMYDFIYANVRKSAMLENDKMQTPSVNVSPLMKDKWKSLRF